MCVWLGCVVGGCLGPCFLAYLAYLAYLFNSNKQLITRQPLATCSSANSTIIHVGPRSPALAPSAPIPQL